MRNMEKNLKIRMRLLIVFLITILIALALTFLSIRQTIKIQKDYTSILTGPIAITYAVQSSETEVNSIARQLRDMALSGYDTSIMDEIQASVDSIEKSISHDSDPLYRFRRASPRLIFSLYVNGKMPLRISIPPFKRIILRRHVG